MSLVIKSGGSNNTALVDSNGNLYVTTANGTRLVSLPVTVQISATTAETTIIAAGGAGVFIDLTGAQITNQSTSPVTVTLKDAVAGTTRAVYDLAASGGIVASYVPPMGASGSNHAWTATLSTTSATVDVNLQYVTVPTL